MATLWKTSSVAQPTKFHYLLKALHDRGSLLRVYTQNIDGLESKVGLNIDISQHPHPPPTCIPLHGQLDYIRCQGCNSTDVIQAHYQSFMSGLLPPCRLCQERQIRRSNVGKRRQSVPAMVPDVLLYGQQHPAGEYVSLIQRQDAHYADLLLVVGTSMKVCGAVSAIKAFAKSIHHAPSPDVPFSTIYLNRGFSAQKTWSGVFDAWIKADCQEIASVLLEKLKPNGTICTTSDGVPPSQEVNQRKLC
jgi:NAD-dependent protein deacetylases, SIR2 family